MASHQDPYMSAIAPSKLTTIDQDTYVINLSTPSQHNRLEDFTCNAALSFRFQCYHRDAETMTFTPVFEEDIPLTLRIERLREKPGRSVAFPYLLDVHPEMTLYTNVCHVNSTDPILRMLNKNLRMTFRYKLEDGIGYLVHTGYDWPDIDDSSLTLFLRSAVNKHRSELDAATKPQSRPAPHT